MFKQFDRVRYVGNPSDENDFGTVLLVSEDQTGALVHFDNNKYDCPETVIDNGKSYFGEWFPVSDLEKVEKTDNPESTTPEN